MLRKRFQIHALAIGLLVAIVALGSASSARAELIEVFYKKHDDGSESTVEYQTDDDSYWYHHMDADGKTTTFQEIFPKGNPNPDGDDDSEPGDRSSRIALAKQKGGEQKVSAVNHLSKYQTANGKGLSVVWNPSDDEGGSVPTAPRGQSIDSAKGNLDNLKNQTAKAKGMANGSVQDFQLNGESLANQVKGMIKKGEADNNNDSTPPGWKQAQMENARLGPIYNPNPVEVKSRGFLLMGATQFGASARVGNSMPAATQFGGAARVGNSLPVATQIGPAANGAFNGQRHSPSSSSQLFSAAAFGPLSGPAAVLRPVAAPRTVR